MSRTLVVLLLGAFLTPAAVVTVLVALLGGLGTLAQATLAAPFVPDLDLLARMAAAAIAASLSIGVPAGVLAGWLTGLRRLGEEGSWLALGTLGVSGRAVLPVAVGLGLAGAVAWAGVLHEIEPRARAALRDTRVEGAVRVRPSADQVLPLGPWLVTVDGDRLVFAGGDWSGTAHRWRLDPAERAVVATLEDVRLRTWDGGADARLERVTVPFGLSSAGAKVHVSERTTSDLIRQIAVSDALARGTYERWVLWKRTLLPASLIPLVLAAAPLALGRRRVGVPMIVGVQAVLLWGVVRVADQRLAGLGLSGATALVAAAALVWPVAAWARWRDR